MASREVRDVQSGHIPALDGIRGLAILAVMVFHFGNFDPAAGIDNLFHKVTSAGWAGVDLFFVLSGFLITGILVDAKGNEHYFRNFYLRRVLRIFPLYYGYLIVLFIVLPLVPGGHTDPTRSPAAPWYWTYTANWFIARHGNWAVATAETGRFWSLSVEEQFYLVWPFVVAVCSRRTLMRVTVGLIAGALLVRCLMLAAHLDSIAVIVSTTARVDALAVGAWLALAIRGPGGAAAVARRIRPVAWLAAGVLAVVIVVCRGPKQEAPLMQTLGFSAIALCGGVLLISTVVAPPSAALARVFTAPVLRMLGRYSYALYILFQVSSDALGQLGLTIDRLPRLAGSQIPAALLVIVVSSLMTLAMALVSWYAYERHFLALKRFFPASAPPARMVPETWETELGEVAGQP
jgi:peptidoglycan/LPS O-acetylase OafA/YrhL